MPTPVQAGCIMIEGQQSVEQVRSLEAIRSECQLVWDAVAAGRSDHFFVDESKLQLVQQEVARLIAQDYANDASTIPPHSRWRHVPDALLQGLQPEQYIDMFTVSVLMDAGAGPSWQYEWNGSVFARSEGIAVAIAVAFADGQFADDRRSKQVDAARLASLTLTDLESVFQATSKDNEMSSLAGRVELLNALGVALGTGAVFSSTHRPSGMVDFIRKHHSSTRIDTKWLWEHVIVAAFNPIWPKTRATLDGQQIGDVHWCALTGRLVPFHKLSQWLCYSLLEPLERLCKFDIVNQHLLTGLAEYRNGGLFVDHGVVGLKHPITGEQDASGQVVVEWRAVTVVLLDRLQKVHFPRLSLPQLLEAGTWKAGRLIARQKRPTGEPPIRVKSDGTLF